MVGELTEIRDFALASLGGAALGGVLGVPERSRSRRSLELRASGSVGSRWQPVFGSSDCLE
jgi:hypothetical protein